MRIAFLTNYPLVDNKGWKQELTLELSKKHEIIVIFGKKTLWGHTAAYFIRRNSTDVKRRIEISSTGAGIKTTQFLRKYGIRYHKVRDINDHVTELILKKFGPDFGMIALDQIVKPHIIDKFRVLLNAHYGNLPNIRGWNATEWSILVEKELYVSLHEVVAKVDAGKIFLKEAVSIARNDDLEQIRVRCQNIAKKLYLRFFSDPTKYLNNPHPNDGGENYYLMNWELRRIVEKIIAQGTYSGLYI